MKTPLEVVIEGENIIAKFANQIVKKVMPVLETLEGQQILTAKGELTAKAQKLLKPLLPEQFKGKSGENFLWKACYFDSSDYSLTIHFRASLNGGSYDVTPSTAFTKYFEKTVYIGNISNQVLKNCYEVEKYKTVNLNAEKKKVEKYKKLKEQLDTLKSSINSEVKEHFYIK